MVNTSDLNAVFAALADPTRRRIVEKLARRPLTVGEIAERFDINSPASRNTCASSSFFRKTALSYIGGDVTETAAQSLLHESALDCELGARRCRGGAR